MSWAREKEKIATETQMSMTKVPILARDLPVAVAFSSDSSGTDLTMSPLSKIIF
jgi:hypothetical protein